MRGVTRGSMGGNIAFGLPVSNDVNEEQKKEWDKANLYYSLEFEDPV